MMATAFHLIGNVTALVTVTKEKMNKTAIMLLNQQQSESKYYQFNKKVFISPNNSKHRKHRSESVCKTESFDSFFVREMTYLGLKCVTLVPVCHLTDKKWVKKTQFYIVTHFDVFCERFGKTWHMHFTKSLQLIVNRFSKRIKRYKKASLQTKYIFSQNFSITFFSAKYSSVEIISISK